MFGFGGTSIVETDPETSTGALYYLVVCLYSPLTDAYFTEVVARERCSDMTMPRHVSTDTRIQNDNEWYKGAGIARVELIDGVPTITERFGEQGWWWNGDTTPKYGDVCAYQDPNSDWIYILGNPPNSIDTWPEKLYIYQARVRQADAFDLDKYEYWWGRVEGWKREVLARCDKETAVMWGAGQGQMVFSEYFGTYIYVHLSESCLGCYNFSPFFL
jgi:hypothetical protein